MAGTKVADGYVQIIPSTKGFEGDLEKALGGEGVGERSGLAIGRGLVGKIIGAVAAMGLAQKLVGVVQDALGAGGALQQSIGGIKTLFEGAEDQMLEYAKNAYQTSGLSANDYMQTATSFAAALTTSVKASGGTVQDAAAMADLAIRDMSDNANKMGTDMESIQNAYQGFAKQNYTMLDNLKLGYGGTKSEMLRLIDDANALKEKQGEVGDLTIDSYADIVEAIHTVQDEMGITGTTMDEAATTYEGSLNMMKASWQNLLASLTLNGEDGAISLEDSMYQLAESASTFLFDNLLPMIGNIITQLPSAIKTFIQTGLPLLLENGRELITTIAQGIRENAPSAGEAFQNMLNNAITWLQEEFPTILENGVAAVQEWISGWGSGDGHMIETVGTTIGLILQTIGLFLGQILIAGGQILWSLLVGFVQNIPNLVANIGQLLITIVNTITGGNAQLTNGGKIILQFLLFGFISFIPQIIQKVRELIQTVLQKFRETDWRSIGMNIITGIINGLWNSITSLWNTLTSIASSALSAVKGALGIASPSKEFAKQVGQFIPSGIAVGIEANASAVTDAMEDLSAQTLTSGVNLASTASYDGVRSGVVDNGESVLSQVYALLSRYLPECANGLMIDGERMASKIDNNMAKNQLRRASAW